MELPDDGRKPGQELDNERPFCLRYGRLNHSSPDWRVNDGLYFGIFEVENFIRQLSSPGATRKVLAGTRAAARRAGLVKLHFAAFGWSPADLSRFREACFDRAPSYNIASIGKASLPDWPRMSMLIR